MRQLNNKQFDTKEGASASHSELSHPQLAPSVSQKDEKMKFKQDKKYSFISKSQSFEANYASDSNFYDLQCTKPMIFNEILRWEVNNYRGFSAYDSPRCENRNGQYVKANYVLTLQYQTECQGNNVWITFKDYEWSFETKKEMMEFLNKYMEYMAKGENDKYGYYNNQVFKIIGGK